MNAAKWHRACTGLYVDPSGTWVISREDNRSWYSIRACLGFGLMLDGKTLFPDYGAIWHGDYKSLAEAKAAVERMVAAGNKPMIDGWEQARLEINTEAVR